MSDLVLPQHRRRQSADDRTAHAHRAEPQIALSLVVVASGADPPERPRAPEVPEKHDPAPAVVVDGEALSVRQVDAVVGALSLSAVVAVGQLDAPWIVGSGTEGDADPEHELRHSDPLDGPHPRIRRADDEARLASTVAPARVGDEIPVAAAVAEIADHLRSRTEVAAAAHRPYVLYGERLPERAPAHDLRPRRARVARSDGDRREQDEQDKTHQAAAATRSRAASTSEASRSPPSAEPSRGSTACSGCGMSPKTFPAALQTPAMSSSAPLGFSPSA